ncbi:efflux transporter periplasmic adaptor subunit [Mesorhizobium sp. SARCC-RB16n]|uniref:efflux RND transporter periplasmic adaptor subunit n=1 Tax=Mesorhizobium sp. SARCC-RB16n TaxID=2116687 RepID=UPI00122FA201|nr:efflux RND transporter periplasmic adaptor subunit [Mesorhizobium sp. SARCC-RB16n]KAA3450310.1 efflux transporter periplasmic adaptor subunit [Mesorhizobium sp. SARCC-RB16n]
MTRGSFIGLAVGLSFVIFALSLAFASVANDRPADAQPATPPRLIKSAVAKTDQPSGATFAGVVQARTETELAFRTLGRVVSRKVEIGDLVHKGDVLAEIDPLALQLAVRSSEADLRNATAQLQYAEITQKRKQALALMNAGSAADLELAEQGLKSAKASVAKARGSLDKARAQLGYAELKAEFDGVVTATSVEVGQMVTGGQSVLKVAYLGQLDVVVDVPEAQLGALRFGTRFDIALQLNSALRTSGSLREIGPEADTATRTHRLKIGLDESPDVFRLGSVVTTTAAGMQREDAIALPATAILLKNGASNVWVIDPASQTVSLRSVQIEGWSANAPKVRVLSGLRAGEVVAIAGVNELSAGQEVKLEKGQRP